MTEREQLVRSSWAVVCADGFTRGEVWNPAYKANAEADARRFDERLARGEFVTHASDYCAGAPHKVVEVSELPEGRAPMIGPPRCGLHGHVIEVRMALEVTFTGAVYTCVRCGTRLRFKAVLSEVGEPELQVWETEKP